MIEIKTQYPFIEEDGSENANLVKHYAEDENGDRYYIQQVQTGIEYEEAIDIYPCRYVYVTTDKKVEYDSI